MVTMVIRYVITKRTIILGALGYNTCPVLKVHVLGPSAVVKDRLQWTKPDFLVQHIPGTLTCDTSNERA